MSACPRGEQHVRRNPSTNSKMIIHGYTKKDHDLKIVVMQNYKKIANFSKAMARSDAYLLGRSHHFGPMIYSYSGASQILGAAIFEVWHFVPIFLSGTILLRQSMRFSCFLLHIFMCVHVVICAGEKLLVTNDGLLTYDGRRRGRTCPYEDILLAVHCSSFRSDTPPKLVVPGPLWSWR